MLNSLRAGSGDRIRQSALLLQHLVNLETAVPAANEELLKTQKGMFFVTLYAALEFTLTTAVSEFLSELQSLSTAPKTYKSGLLPTLLNREFNAAFSASKRLTWTHRRSLINRVFAADPCTIDNDVFPAESTNVSADHFEEIWQQLELPGASLPPGINPWTLNEIKEHRNAIAHGREKASSIGARFTLAALDDRHRAVEAICAYTVLSFEEHLKNKSYLSQS